MVGPLVNAPSLAEHTGFIVAEEDALKSYLTGIQIPDERVGKPPVDVGVWYRWPTSERQIKYPFITIDAIGAEPEYSLFTSEYRQTGRDIYVPSTSPFLPTPPSGWVAQNYGIRNYLPFKLTYQVSYFARSAQHDRFLRSIFATDVFPPRPFWIHVAADDTWRRCEWVATSPNDRAETSESGTKRVFQKAYTVTILAEISQERIIDSVFYTVFKVRMSVKDRQFVEEWASADHEGVEVPSLSG